MLEELTAPANEIHKIYPETTTMVSFTGNQSFILGTLLPLLTKDIIYGGHQPYVVYVSDQFDPEQGDSSVLKHISYSCTDWVYSGFTYPAYATDYVLLINCMQLNGTQLLKKVYQSMEKEYIGPLGRPSISVIIIQEDIASIPLSIPTYNIDYLALVAADLIKNRSRTLLNVTSMTNNVSPTRRRQNSTLVLIDIEAALPSVQLFINKPFSGFHGKLLHVTTADYTPFTKIARTKEGKVFDGYTIEILKAFSEKFDFRYDIEEEEDYGGLDENGTWIGMVGLVSRFEKDMAFAGLTITSQRELAVDFSKPFWYETSSVAVHLASRNFFYIFNTFTSNVWVTLAAMLVFAALTLAFIDLVTCKLTHGSYLMRTKFSIDSSFQAVCLFFMQSAQLDSSAASLRVVVSALSLGLVIISSTYSGNLIASLTVQDIQLPFKTLEELAANDMYTILLKPYSSHHTLLEESRSGVYARLWQKIAKKKSESFCESGDVCFERLMSAPNKYVKVDDYTRQLKKYVPQSDCKVTILPELFFPAGFGIALPEGSPFKPYFDEGIQQMEENGLLLKWQKMHWPPDECEAKRREERLKTDAITLGDIGAIFVVLGCGIGGATLALALEFLATNICVILNRAKLGATLPAKGYEK